MEEDQEDEPEDFEAADTSRQLIPKSNFPPQVDETVIAKVENPDIDKEIKPVDLDMIKMEELE